MNKKGLVGLMALCFTVVIICVIAYILFIKYFLNPMGSDWQTQQIVNKSGLDTSDPLSILESAKNQINEAQEFHYQEPPQAFNMAAQ